MIETKEELNKIKTEKKLDKSLKIRAVPEIIVFNSEEGNGNDIDIYLPEVEKDTIELKVIKDYITVYGESETVTYDGFYNLCCPIDIEKAHSTYKDGLLKIHVPFKKPESDNNVITVN